MTSTASGSSPASLIGQVVEVGVKLLAIGVPVLYGVGRAYNEGFWRGVGLSPSLMPLNAEGYLYAGFVAILNMFAGVIGVAGEFTLSRFLIATLSATGVVMVLLSARSWFRVGFKNRSRRFEAALRALRIRHRVVLLDWIAPLLQLCWTIAALALTVFGIALLVLLPFVAAYQSGKEYGHSTSLAYARQYAGHFAFPAPMARGPGITYALFLQCSASWCIIYGENRFEAISPSAVASVGHWVEAKKFEMPLDGRRLPSAFTNDRKRSGVPDVRTQPWKPGKPSDSKRR